MSIRVSRSLLALLAAVLLPACSAPSADAPAAAASTPDRTSSRGGTAVIGSITDVDSWNEYVSRQSFANGLLRRIYVRLAREAAGANGSPPAFEPDLAESWSFSDDGLALTFRLREARWSDGVPITAEDVRFTWQAQTSPDVPWIAVASKQAIEDVVVEEPRQVTFRFDHRYPNQLADAVEGGVVPSHVFGEVPLAEWATRDWSAARIGSGPFVLERHRPGDEIRLGRNPHYYGPAAPLDAIVVRVVPDVSSLIVQLRAGSIDYVEGVPPRDARSLERDGAATITGFDRPGYDFIGWNARRPPFDDPEVRRAMTLAIDREALVEDLLYGHGRVSAGPLLSFWPGADPAVRPLPYDPEGARGILEARGYATAATGAMTASRDNRLRLELLTNAGNRQREEALLKIQDQLRRVGVEVEVRPMEMRAMRERIAAGDFDAYLGGWVYAIQDLRSVFGVDYAFPRGGNVVGYASPEAERLFDAFEQAPDWDAALAPLSALQRRIHDDQPYTFLYEARRLAAYGPRVEPVAIDVPNDPLAVLERLRIR